MCIRDSNLCVDHNPTAFLLSINRFVQRIHDPAWLSLFLAELNDSDVTQGIYAAYYDQVKNLYVCFSAVPITLLISEAFAW